MTSITNTRILGTCLEMCSEKEKKLRVKNKIIHPLERSLGKDNEKEFILIKSFSRSAAGNTSCCDPTEIRPPYICRRTTNYLVQNVLFENIDGYQKLRLDWTTYHFVFDRLRAIRQDMIVQKCDLMEPVFDIDEIIIHIQILQVCVKFHLLANYILGQSNDNSNCPKNTKHSSVNNQFDQHINFTHLLECIKMILNYYESQFLRICDSHLGTDDSKIVKNGNVKRVDESIIDMIAIYILLNIGSYHSYKWGLELNEKVKSNKKINRALKMHRLYVERNYIALFKESKKLSLIHLLAFYWSLPHIFNEMLTVMSTAYSSKNCKFPLKHFIKMISFDERSKEKLVWYFKEKNIKILETSSDSLNTHTAANDLSDIFICFDKNTYSQSMNIKWQELPYIDKQLDGSDLMSLLLDYD